MSTNERPAPETQAEIDRFNELCDIPVSADFAALLEQQRDEARENNGRNAAMLTRTLIERDRARRQRDELLKALEAMLAARIDPMGIEAANADEQARSAIAAENQNRRGDTSDCRCAFHVTKPDCSANGSNSITR